MKRKVVILSIVGAAILASVLGGIIIYKSTYAITSTFMNKNNTVQTAKEEPLGSEQKELLKSRISTHMMGISSFDSYCSYMYAIMNISMGTRDKEVAKVRLTDVYGELYKPTVEEVFNTIARQTKTVYKYDSKEKEWIFTPADVKRPYSLKLAQNWTEHDMGVFIKYEPKIAPVGMDIYVLGSYSIEDNKEATLNKILESTAVNFALPINKDVSLKDMKVVSVNGVKAIYYETKCIPGMTWRQWALIKSDKLFVIVSSIDDEDESELFPDVKSMVDSFMVLE